MPSPTIILAVVAVLVLIAAAYFAFGGPKSFIISQTIGVKQGFLAVDPSGVVALVADKKGATTFTGSQAYGTPTTIKDSKTGLLLTTSTDGTYMVGAATGGDKFVFAPTTATQVKGVATGAMLNAAPIRWFHTSNSNGGNTWLVSSGGGGAHDVDKRIYFTTDTSVSAFGEKTWALYQPAKKAST